MLLLGAGSVLMILLGATSELIILLGAHITMILEAESALIVFLLGAGSALITFLEAGSPYVPRSGLAGGCSPRYPVRSSSRWPPLSEAVAKNEQPSTARDRLGMDAPQ